MTTIFSPEPGALAPLRAKWGWIVALGVVYLVAGLIALGSVVMATAASVLVVGVMMIVAGVFEVIHAFQLKSWGRFALWLLLGILYIVAGFVAWDNPLLTAVWLTLILGAALVASGTHAHFPCVGHEAGLAMDRGRGVGPRHAVARCDHPGEMAGLGGLYARHLPRDRPCGRWRELDRPRVFAEERRAGHDVIRFPQDRLAIRVNGIARKSYRRRADLRASGIRFPNEPFGNRMSQRPAFRALRWP